MWRSDNLYLSFMSQKPAADVPVENLTVKPSTDVVSKLPAQKGGKS